MIEKMEGEYGLKVCWNLDMVNFSLYFRSLTFICFLSWLTQLCLKDRDLLPGVMFEHEVIGRLIEERCNRFLVIFSPNFLRSAANQFLVSYAQASALGL